MGSGWEMGQEMTGTAFGGCVRFGGHAAAIEGRAPVSSGMAEAWPGEGPSSFQNRPSTMTPPLGIA